MPDFPWYGSMSGNDLSQGDLLPSCPHIQSDGQGNIEQVVYDVVVISQSCDLANGKLEMIQVCPYWPLSRMVTLVPFLQSKKGREELRRGNLPGYHVLNRCELPGLETELLVLDFRGLFGVGKATLLERTSALAYRVRLLPPYREHLAQAFARFFIRVGLPVDIPAF